jgi:PKD repeat protein
VIDLGPTAAFSWSPEPQDEGAVVEFTDESTSYPDDIVAWSWDFGGLDTSTEQDPGFTFMDDGTYEVCLTVTDDDGSTDTVCHNVTVDNVAPDVTASNDGPIDEGSSATIEVTASDPAGVNDPLSYEFDCDNDGSYEVGPQTDNTASCFFGNDGTFTVGVRVSDDDGGVTTASTVVIVNNVAPEVTASPASQTVQYSDYIAQVTIDATDVSEDLPLEASTEWQVDGGSWQASPSLPTGLVWTAQGCNTTDPGTCTWRISGTAGVPEGAYTIRVTVDDDDGGLTTFDILITVTPEDATVTFDKDNPVAVQVDTPGSDTSQAFSLVVYVKETYPDAGDYGTAPGDISLAEVSMSLVPVGPGGGETAVCTTQGETTELGLKFECEFDDLPVNTYSAEATVGGGYYAGYGEDVLVVYDPSLGFTTGGGWFYWPGSEDLDTGYPGDKTNFGYTMKYNKKGQKVRGSLLLIRHLPDGTIYRVKSNALYGLALGTGDDGGEEYGWASFSGKCTYKDKGWEEAEGNHEFLVYVEDWNEPGAGHDQFWIEVYDKDDNVIAVMSMDRPADGNTETLGGGNIVVPHGGGGGKKR